MTITVWSVKVLKDIGSWYSFLGFLWNLTFIKSAIFKGFPVTGHYLNFLMKGIMLINSYKIPSDVQTGFEKGWRPKAQQ